MKKSKYKIRYLQTFSKELDDIIRYIVLILNNEKAADNLLKKIEESIQKRSENPEIFETYKGKKQMKYNWYRIYVGNFTIFYTVRNNIMEVTHIIYSARDLDRLI